MQNAASNSPRHDDDAQKSHTRNSLHVMLLIDRAHNAPVWAPAQPKPAPLSRPSTDTNLGTSPPKQEGAHHPPTSQDPCISRPQRHARPTGVSHARCDTDRGMKATECPSAGADRAFGKPPAVDWVEMHDGVGGVVRSVGRGVLTVCGWVGGGRTTVGGDADADGEAARHEGKSSGRLPGWDDGRRWSVQGTELNKAGKPPMAPPHPVAPSRRNASRPDKPIRQRISLG
ncbi:hypothetical protein V497_05552 [Pseudogymnoascus sp. VKM F-4516 (FW-969)]|nr:hypothetical protein V497_05552 [Pseudogymnoascus sp. VKM F-4516 (FW-969)]